MESRLKDVPPAPPALRLQVVPTPPPAPIDRGAVLVWTAIAGLYVLGGIVLAVVLLT